MAKHNINDLVVTPSSQVGKISSFTDRGTKANVCLDARGTKIVTVSLASLTKATDQQRQQWREENGFS